MLKITIQETKTHITLKLDGRLAGPWVSELARVWEAQKSHLGEMHYVFDLRDVTFANAEGVLLLKTIYEETQAAILATTPSTQALSDEIQGNWKGCDRNGDQHVS